MTVRGGPGGYEAFINDIRRIFGITAEHDMQLAFDCADPVTGALFILHAYGTGLRLRPALRVRLWHGSAQIDAASQV